MARVTSHEEDAVAPEAAAPAATEAPRIALLPLARLGDDAAGLCADGVCRLPE